jgi:hypothetical protein
MKAIAGTQYGTQYGSQGVVQVQEAAKSTQKGKVSTSSRVTYSRVIGALFLLGFLSYGGGFGLVTSFTGAPDFLSAIFANQSSFIVGAFLMLVNTLVDVGKGVLFFPILENHGKRTALAYLAALIVQVVLLDIGLLCLLMLVPLGQYAVAAGGANAALATALGSLLTQANTMAYQIGQATLAVGGLFLCALLFRTRLIPRFLAAWGVIGYAIHVVGAIAEIFGIPISLMLLIPGGLFELALGFWLLIKGFLPAAYGYRRDDRVAEMGTA